MYRRVFKIFRILGLGNSSRISIIYTYFAVTIEGAETFKGFFLQARSIDTDQWIGTWENAPNTTIHPECSSITHADPKEKLRAVLLWRAPPDAQGRVYFT